MFYTFLKVYVFFHSVDIHLSSNFKESNVLLKYIKCIMHLFEIYFLQL